jgi:hypothetical protein
MAKLLLGDLHRHSQIVQERRVNVSELMPRHASEPGLTDLSGAIDRRCKTTSLIRQPHGRHGPRHLLMPTAACSARRSDRATACRPELLIACYRLAPGPGNSGTAQGRVRNT